MSSLKVATILFFLTFIVQAQNSMQEGFDQLEKGEFAKAEIFFKSYLENEPSNKTARLCYGRAVGLNGDPSKANTLFDDLLKDYPNDFEVAINYNESFLWGKAYEKARPLYKKLVNDYPDKFAALLGYANTLSNLKEYELALHWVNKALELQPDNNSAKVSRKYIKLGFASQYINAQDYAKGKAFLKSIFSDFPEDKDALLNLANYYLITKEVENAKRIYWRYATSFKDSITAINGVALAEHIGEHDKKALTMSEMAIKKVAKIKDSVLTQRTYERYVQALVWNHKYNDAKKKIASLEKDYGELPWILSLKATLGMYTGNFKMSRNNYSALLSKDSGSFDGNLGMANALLASDRVMPAYQAAYQTLNVFKGQKDAKGFIEKLDGMHTPTIEDHMVYTFDNGNNVAYSNTLNAFVPFSTKFKTTLTYQFRNTQNSVTGNHADSHLLIAGLDYKLRPHMKLITVFGVSNNRFVAAEYTQPILDIKLQMVPLRLQNLELGYQREVQSFNAELIEREIVMNHYGLKYNLGTNFNLGWYTQMMYTEQTDNNTRSLLFTSLYYNLLRKPALKFGFNYQYISFKDQLPTIYFSPSQYQAVEVFADITGKITEKTTYSASAASGIQRVEEDPQTNIFRAEASIKQQFGKRLSLKVYGKYSNIASATAAGFEFVELGLKLKWLFTKKPLFTTKSKQDITIW